MGEVSISDAEVPLLILASMPNPPLCAAEGKMFSRLAVPLIEFHEVRLPDSKPLTKTDSPTGSAVGVAVEVALAVAVAVLVGVAIGVAGKGVFVAVGVDMTIVVGIAVTVGVMVGVLAGVIVRSGVGVSVGIMPASELYAASTSILPAPKTLSAPSSPRSIAFSRKASSCCITVKLGKALSKSAKEPEA